MNILQAFVLAVVEGLTEFLPISSTGHLILTAKLLNIPDSNFLKTFEITIQLGAILAVVVLYSKRLLTNIEIYKKLFVAFLPTALVGFTLYPLIKNYLLGNSSVTLHSLFWGGIALIVIEYFNSKHHRSLKDFDPTYKQAFIIGIFQCFSVVPGVSRAAATILGGLAVGLNRSKAAEFSFLLAVPTMLAATTLDIYKSRGILTDGWILTLFFGTAFAFIFAMASIKFLVGFVKNNDFTLFGIYRILLAVAFWIAGVK